MDEKRGEINKDVFKNSCKQDKKFETKFRIWIEKDGKHVLGKGGAEILQAIKDEGSISAASKKLGMSYRYVWNYIKKIEHNLGEEVVIRGRGGIKGGGTVLTDSGERLLSHYIFVNKTICETLFNLTYSRSREFKNCEQ